MILRPRKGRNFSPATQQLRLACERSGLTCVEIAHKCEVLPYVVSQACAEGEISQRLINKVRGFFGLALLPESQGRRARPTRSNSRQRKTQEPTVNQPLAPDLVPPSDHAKGEALPDCDWVAVAAAAKELSGAAEDFEFLRVRFQEADFRLRAARRRALACGIAVVPALVGGSGQALPNNKTTVRFFKLMSVGGAIPQ